LGEDLVGEEILGAESEYSASSQEIVGALKAMKKE
jgi:hypothetical protein